MNKMIHMMRNTRTHFLFILPLSIALLAIYQLPAIGQTKEDCLACHSDQSLTMEKAQKSVSLFVDENVLSSSAHKKLLCTACHTGFNPNEVPHKESIKPINCMNCHKDAPAKHSFHPQMMKAVSGAGQSDISCKHCHGTHDITSPKALGSKFNGVNLIETCGKCHSDVKEKFVTSSHAKALKSGIPHAPSCITCHVNDIVRVRAGKDSAQVKVAQERMCLSCHLDDPAIRERTTPATGFIAAYEKSVHGAALLKGNAKAANCVDCHGSHEMKKSYDPTALVNKAHIPEQCGHCHESIANEFAQSVHGASLAEGNRDAPACTDCHGEHNILLHNDPRSPVAPLNVSGRVCSPCHSSLKL
ncbi:MAG TPA: cytochrome B, partial [Bacteroidota bacterium]|nr:cytochrome B [Bacteroidota bacterium]